MKVNLSLSLHQHPIMKAYGMETQLHTFLNSVLHGGECSVPSLHHFIPREIAPDTNLTGGRTGPRTGFSLIYICIWCVKIWPSFFGIHQCIFFSVSEKFHRFITETKGELIQNCFRHEKTRRT
jgi:hypothetical protein